MGGALLVSARRSGDEEFLATECHARPAIRAARWQLPSRLVRVRVRLRVRVRVSSVAWSIARDATGGAGVRAWVGVACAMVRSACGTSAGSLWHGAMAWRYGMALWHGAMACHIWHGACTKTSGSPVVAGREMRKPVASAGRVRR